MSEMRGLAWGPLPLPEFLTLQLDAHGFAPSDAAKCATDLRSVPGRAAAASLFVDLGSCKFLEGDIDGAVAAWRQAITSDHDAAAARALLNMGLMYEHLHLFPRALIVLTAVADRAVAPHEVPAALALARCQRTLGDTETATETVALLASATMAERPHAPELSEILLALGDLAHGADRPDRAERSWRVAVAGPDSPARRIAASRLLRLSLEQGHDDEFVELLATDDSEQAVAAVVLDRAEGLARLGHDDRAIELMATLDDHALTSTERFRLADFHIHLGQVNQGIDQLEVLLGSPIPEIWQRAAFVLGGLYSDYEMPEVAGQMFDRVRTHQDRYWSGKAALARGDLFSVAGEHDRAAALWAEAGESEVGAVRAHARDRRPGGAARIIESPEAADVEAEPVAAAEPVVVALDGLTVAEPRVDEPSIDEPSVDEPRVEEPSVVAEPVPAAEPVVVALDGLTVDEPSVDEPSVDEPSVVAEPVAAAEPVVVALGDTTDVRDADVTARGPELMVVAGDSAERDLVSNTDGQPVISLVEDSRTDARALHAAAPSKSVFARLSDLDEPVDLADATGSYYDDGIGLAHSEAVAGNPYAALAPEGVAPASSPGNPYAELAPSYDAEFKPADDVEPGDWESMLEDWPAAEQPEARRGRRGNKSSAFSRYT